MRDQDRERGEIRKEGNGFNEQGLREKDSSETHPAFFRQVEA